jgi:hypothetical protein
VVRTGAEDDVAESHKERVDRELIELLNEVRVALPGVQVLFAFLLVVPFQQSFAELTSLERQIYYIAFVTTAAASVLLIAPSTYHRIRFREGDKEQMLRTSNRFVLGGSLLLGVAIASVTFLVTDMVFGNPAGATAAAIAAVVVGWFWFGLPLSRKVRDQRDPGDQGDDGDQGPSPQEGSRGSDNGS